MVKSAYIHIPFCESICAYCDFCKFLYNNEWVDRYLKELKKEIELNYKGEDLKTIYIGGGTPSSLNLKQLKLLLDICSVFKKTKNYEYTVEVNIENINEEKAILLKEYGVNRISVGVETFNSKLLKVIERSHTKDMVLSKILMLKKYFNNINIDLMYALPNENLSDVKSDLASFLSLDVPHISLYSLIIEQHTKFSVKKIEYIDEDLDYAMYEYINKVLKENGYIHYETSNYAKDGFQSMHNLTYWHNLEYYGFGIGASGYLNNVRYENTHSINNYLSGNYVMDSHELSKLESMQNFVILGLRMIEGISLSEFKERYNQDLEDVFEIREMLEDGRLEINNNRLFINDKYTYLANEILINFI